MCIKKHKLIFVTGVPGAGKTFVIQHQPALQGLPVVDIRSIYEMHSEFNGIGGWMLAQDMMIDWATRLMKSRRTDVVCEAILLPGTPSRERLMFQLKAHRLKASFIDIKADYFTCVERVANDYTAIRAQHKGNEQQLEVDMNYYMKRMDILRSYHAKGIV